MLFFAMIDTIIFDLGGVIVNIDRDCSVRAFESLGLKDAASYLDPYHQNGFFLELEDGRLDVTGFCNHLRWLCNGPVSFSQAQKAWMAFITDVPGERLSYIHNLRKDYQVCLLSNTNPFIMEWARSNRFTPEGRRLDDYFDHLFLSYEMKCVKPGREIFDMVINRLQTDPKKVLLIDDGPANVCMGRQLGMRTYMPANGVNWIPAVQKLLANSVTSLNNSR
jgi:HAD superfamily hydrolase (TIGR01509 family)